jgi:hypothetical protein
MQACLQLYVPALGQPGRLGLEGRDRPSVAGFFRRMAGGGNAFRLFALHTLACLFGEHGTADAPGHGPHGAEDGQPDDAARHARGDRGDLAALAHAFDFGGPRRRERGPGAVTDGTAGNRGYHHGGDVRVTIAKVAAVLAVVVVVAGGPRGRRATVIIGGLAVGTAAEGRKRRGRRCGLRRLWRGRLRGTVTVNGRWNLCWCWWWRLRIGRIVGRRRCRWRRHGGVRIVRGRSGGWRGNSSAGTRQGTHGRRGRRGLELRHRRRGEIDRLVVNEQVTVAQDGSRRRQNVGKLRPVLKVGTFVVSIAVAVVTHVASDEERL